MTAVDWVALGLVLLAALGGAVQGLVWSGLSLAGLLAGAFVGGRLAPVLLTGGSGSRYAPVVALVAAVALAVAFEVVGSTIGGVIRSRERARSVRTLDSAGGVFAGALIGLAIVWVLGVMALQLPGQANLRQAVQRSYVLQRLNDIVPPRSLLNALARIDPFPTFAGPPVPAEPPDPAVLRTPGVREAAPSVVRVLGTACGLGVEGSGWVAAPGVVVTAAHVVAGEDDTSVTTVTGASLSATAVVFDPHDDVAVLRVPGLDAMPLRLVDPKAGAPVAIVGYPLNGPLNATASRIGTTATVLAQDAYGRGPTRRLVTSLAGRVEHGNSGGPAVDATGAVQSTVFAARAAGDGGYGVPASIVRRDLARAGGPVSTGSCVN
ncbi:MAG TPA: MarP family serine protease [Gaiellaceae bacterium]|nr:MarP family serine protease [Gaiellaceae bacterium]